jgi:serine/threonine protein kinase
LKILKKPIDEESSEADEEDAAATDAADGSTSTADELPASLPARVQREIEAMRSIDSRRVVSILDGPETRRIGGQLYWWYLEPFYPGGTLEDRIAQGSLTTGEAEVLCEGLLEAIEDIWTQVRIVHRDVKPANVVFDAQGAPVLLDLGIALALDATPLTDPSMLGPRTNRYCAPEQLLPRRVADLDFRTDLFSVGVTVYEAWTGTHPFEPFDGFFAGRRMNGEFDREVLARQPDGAALKAVLARLLGAKQHERYRLPRLALAALRGEGQ